MDLSELGPGDHLCVLYRTEEEHRELVVPFVRQGFERGEKVVYIADAHTAEEILGYLRDCGMDLEKLLWTGQLSVLGREDAYMRGGIFDPAAMIGLLEEETSLALSQGYPCLRVTGEMAWALRGLPGSERLIEYEARLNRFFPKSACLALCQYDLRSFSPEVLLGVIDTHPLVVAGGRVYDNFFYVPPEKMLGEGRAAAELERRLRDLEENRRLRQELRQECDKFSMAFLASPVPMALTRRSDGKLLEANRAFEDLTGRSREEVLGKSTLELGVFRDRSDRERFMKRLEEAGEVRGLEMSFLDARGEAEPVSSRRSR